MRKRTYSLLKTYYNESERQIDGILTRLRRSETTSDPLIEQENQENPVSLTPVYNWDQWISATKTKNFLLGDPLLDYLSEVPIRPNFSYENTPLIIPQKIIIEKGNQFEDEVMKKLYLRFPNEIQEICEPKFARDPAKYQETINAMRNGIPIIYQGVLHNHANQTYGAPDLLVRSDFINRIFEKRVLDINDIYKPSPNLITANGKIPSYHYLVVDIKWSTLNLRSDGVHLLNDDYAKAYKGQLYIYTQALSNTLGIEISSAFILGRKWRYTTKGNTYEGRGWFDRLGKIDYSGHDKEYVQKTQEALEWFRKLKSEGKQWNLYPPSIPELYPNMCNKYDNRWHKFKKRLAEDIGEITMIWNCGIKERLNALSNGITSWRDPRCDASQMGITTEYKSKIINQIIEVNRNQNVLMLPERIENNFQNWKQRTPIEFYFDFETVNELIIDFNGDSTSPGFDLIFMIGIGWYHPLTKEWIYKTFTVTDLSYTSEKTMFTEFMEYIHSVTENYTGENYPKFFHWGTAEKNMLKKCWARHSNFPELNITFDNLTKNWIDFLQVFKSEPIVVKGCFNFGLKNISTAMIKHGMIQSSWGEDKFGCSDGLKAMFLASQVYKEASEKQISVTKLPKMKSIIEYNEIDCKVIGEIVEYLRKHKI